MTPSIGFIGLGRMGEPMSRNLIAAGFTLTAYDIDAEKCSRLEAAGARIAGSPGEVAAGTDISLSIVMNDSVLEQVALGPDGVLAEAQPGHLFCDLSTVSPAMSQRVAQAAGTAQVHYVCAKVAGSTGLARDGALAVFGSGDAADFERIRPVLDVLGARVLHVGAGDAAAYLKLVHSVIVGVYAGLLGEAIAFGEKGGLELSTLVDVLESGPVGSVLLTTKAKALKARAFESPPSDIDTAAKDLDLVVDAARRCAVPMPLTALARAMMSHQQALDEGKRDIFSVLEACERLAGLSGRLDSEDAAG